MKRIALVVLAAAVASSVLGQGGEKDAKQDGVVKPKHRATAAVPDGPVTQAEARATLIRARSALHAVLNKPIGGAVSLANSPAPVTRTAVVDELWKLYQGTKPWHKMTLRAVRYDKSLLRMANPGTRANLEKLIAVGCVARIGPLATGPKDSLTVHEFGDAIGFFMARICQLTHMPLPKWTPALGAGSE